MHISTVNRRLGGPIVADSRAIGFLSLAGRSGVVYNGAALLE